MVNVRKMRMFVRHGLVNMPVAVRLRAIPSNVMRMLMVFVMPVLMHVF